MHSNIKAVNQSIILKQGKKIMIQIEEIVPKRMLNENENLLK